MNRLVIILGVVAVALYLLFSSIFIVHQREQAIVMRFGEIVRVHRDPGLYFKIPTDIVETVQIIEERLLRYDLEDITLQVSGGRFYNVDAFLTYRIVDPVRFRQSVLGSLDLAEQRINTRLESALRRVYGLREFNAALSEQRTEMMREARDLIVPDMAELGIEVVDVRILRTDLTAQVSAQTYERMMAERLAEAALLRARGREQAETLRAIADRQAVEIVAVANRDSEILRGEGEATRAGILAAAYTADPEFFEFYRAMESYRVALGGGGATMVLSPNSEFFAFFGSDSGAVFPPQVPLIPVGQDDAEDEAGETVPAAALPEAEDEAPEEEAPEDGTGLEDAASPEDGDEAPDGEISLEDATLPLEPLQPFEPDGQDDAPAQ